ncbi:diguanylate cyclase [Burkholderia diffusa]|uniref:diguanylate cyclase n=1 Tax=Burkholderia diffusa TaxID=488732 RepID=UPI00075885F7|nr:diguanylate cyclase [Burkholderia diffusa]AOI59734.1 diguanylate cyclase response regulator [Burkholderia diffusa]KUZ11348.1 diguanylate cyclase response regulator [Burkholderia diffusa]KVC43216.1 diguanylate cyclase response regulator [Burkholderia diffusa]KVG29801.1 diguanylate cyclase response regulator [Burkholderia diffusa]KVH45924.1 diguanylate cyclase response regulator [Burkholderia diffusa]
MTSDFTRPPGGLHAAFGAAHAAPTPHADAPAMVLLVDDQTIVAEAIRRALVDEDGIDFHYCPRSDDALASAIETRPTVILQDLVMPGTDGLSLVKAYRANPATRDVPIIVLSTQEEPVIKSAAFAAGANDYLVKLPDRIELIARIRYHSRSYMNLLQRDEAYRALRQSQQQLLEANLELRRLTHSDGLTGLSNRRYLDEYLAAEWRRGTRERSELSLLMIDVDNFKLYNDTYGHVSGDSVLKQVAATIERSLGQAGDLAARFGGEEFAVVMPATSPGAARLLGEKIRLAVESLRLEHAHSSTGRYVTISIGGASIVPAAGVPTTSLIEAADRALYRAKHDGKNRVEIDAPPAPAAPPVGGGFA